MRDCAGQTRVELCINYGLFGMAFHKNGKSDERSHAVFSLETAMFAYKPVPTLQKC